MAKIYFTKLTMELLLVCTGTHKGELCWLAGSSIKQVQFLEGMGNFCSWTMHQKSEEAKGFFPSDFDLLRPAEDAADCGYSFQSVPVSWELYHFQWHRVLTGAGILRWWWFHRSAEDSTEGGVWLWLSFASGWKGSEAGA